MASLESTGSPPPRSRASARFTIHEEQEGKTSTAGIADLIEAVCLYESTRVLADSI